MHVIDDDDLLAHTLNSIRENDKWKTFITFVYVRDLLLNFEQPILS